MPLLHSLGCVLSVVVLLDGEPLPQSEVLSALKQVFNKDLSVLCSVHLSLIPNQQSLPLKIIMVPPACFTVEMVPGFLQT